MEDDAAYEDLGPGLHVLREAEPLTRAGALAAQLRAELCATVLQAEAALAARSALPPIDVATLATLRVLSRRVARAERVAARTRERAVHDLGQRLAGTGSALAIHPTTIRERAATVLAARAALAEAERALTEHVSGVDDPAPPEVSDESAAPPEVALPVAPTRRPGPPPAVRRSRSLGAIVAAFGMTLLVMGLGLLPLWAALLFPLAASLWALRYLQPRGHHDVPASEGASASESDGASEEASARLAEVAASADELFEARRAEEERAAQRAHLEQRRVRAEEQLQAAERAWHDVAGAGCDVSEVDEVIRRLDPQHADARVAASQTAGVRATDAVLYEFRQRWEAFWQELGMPAPDPADGERAVDELAARVGRPIVLVGSAAAWGSDLARAAPASPVVVLEGPVDAEPVLS